MGAVWGLGVRRLVHFVVRCTTSAAYTLQGETLVALLYSQGGAAAWMKLRSRVIPSRGAAGKKTECGRASDDTPVRQKVAPMDATMHSDDGAPTPMNTPVDLRGDSHNDDDEDHVVLALLELKHAPPPRRENRRSIPAKTRFKPRQPKDPREYDVVVCRDPCGGFSRAVIDPLLAWLYSNRLNPYPTTDEKIEFVRETGLTLMQINNWFSNARRRLLKKMKKGGRSLRR